MTLWPWQKIDHPSRLAGGFFGQSTGRKICRNKRDGMKLVKRKPLPLTDLRASFAFKCAQHMNLHPQTFQQCASAQCGQIDHERTANDFGTQPFK